MKKILLFLLVATLGCGNVYSQTKKPVRRTASVAAKQKAEAQGKAIRSTGWTEKKKKK